MPAIVPTGIVSLVVRVMPRAPHSRRHALSSHPSRQMGIGGEIEPGGTPFDPRKRDQFDRVEAGGADLI